MAQISDATPWLRYWKPRPTTHLRLFCFPYAGGSASLFRSWSIVALGGIEICPVQLPGREERLMEAPFSQLSHLVESLGQALLPYLDIPYAFFGHSMGALIGFELARYLQQRKGAQAPAHLYVSGHRAPQLLATDLPSYHLSEREFVAELRRLQGTPEEVLQNADLLPFLLPLLRADFELCQTYAYVAGLPLACPITAFGGLTDPEVTSEEIQAWNVQTRGAFHCQFFAGNHFFLHEKQEDLLQFVARDLLALR